MLVVPIPAGALMLEELMRYERWLHLYTNRYRPERTSQRGDFVEPAGKGYKPVLLAPAKWVITPGQPPLAVYPKVTFTFSGAVGDVFGYLVTASDGTLRWAEPFRLDDAGAPLPI